MIFQAFFRAAGIGKTGLADMVVDVYRSSDRTRIVTGASGLEVGGGAYQYSLTGFLDGSQTYTAVFKTADVTVDFKHVAVTRDDPFAMPVPGAYPSGTAGAAIARLASGAIVARPIVALSGNVTIYRGADYKTADGRALEWADTASIWPVTTGGDCLLSIAGIEYAGTFATSGGIVSAFVELSALQTATMLPGSYDYRLDAVLVSGNVVPLASGQAIVT